MEKKKTESGNGNGNGLSKNAEDLLRRLKKNDQPVKELMVSFNVDEKHVLELAEGLRKCGHNVSVYSVESEKYLSLARLEERKWPETPIFKVGASEWSKSAPRVGFVSGLDFGDEGFRAGLLLNAFEIFAKEACRYICLVGRLVSKKKLRERLMTVPARLRREFELALIRESAEGLASAIPKIRKPGSKNEFVRTYIVTSPPYDGEIGERVARKLRELRPEDIRVYNPVSDRVEVKEINKQIGLICPAFGRLPSEYYSTMVDREVKDKESQTSHNYPDLWVVGTPSSSVHIPPRRRKPPVISLPSLKCLKIIRVGENQEGIRIVEFSRGGNEYVVRTYSMKDLTKNERRFISCTKEGVKDIHKKIVEIIKAEGARSEGVIADRLKMENERDKVKAAIQFLVDEKRTTRKTWPGLYYDPYSQRYDFHPDWIQEQLRYPGLTSDQLTDERFMFFSCLHAGYNTTDYEYIVKVLPEILIRNRVKYVCCLGDIVAGLSHNFLEAGEVMGGMNYTEQEQFGAELIGTGLLKVFEHGLRSMPGLRKFSAGELIDALLPTFIYIAGNHDDWQKRLGVSPLREFHNDLINLLSDRVATLLKKTHELPPASDLRAVLNKKLIRLSIDGSSYNPIFVLPSGLTLELHHPHMGRAKTKSLRAQEILDSSDANIVGQGNFHTAIVTEKWEPDIGQRVNVEAGTFVIFTNFEKSKGKDVSFGPIYLRVLSHNKRIVMSESAYYNIPLLKQPYPKCTDWQKLKSDLGVYRAP